jgi:site-specific DNA-methyltransferase (adenine-specific)
MQLAPNDIYCAPCEHLLSDLDEPIADLIFADPPFNINYAYDLYKDNRLYDDYVQWSERWMRVCLEKALKPTGSMWIAIGDDFAAEIRMLGRKLGLTLRNWIIWHYTFGQQTSRKFGRTHTHIFYFVKDANAFTFNDLDIRIESERQKTGDARANPLGKIPGDVWTISRVCGTFDKRVAWHPCQMPEELLERVIKATSNFGDLVLDPFSGSGTTCAVAKWLHRQYIGVETSPMYVTKSLERINGLR